MLPKSERADDAWRVIAALVDAARQRHGITREIPVHAVGSKRPARCAGVADRHPAAGRESLRLRPHGFRARPSWRDFAGAMRSVPDSSRIRWSRAKCEIAAAALGATVSCPRTT